MKKLILRAAVVSFLVCMTLLLSGCNGPEVKPEDPHRIESIDPDAPLRDWR